MEENRKFAPHHMLKKTFRRLWRQLGTKCGLDLLNILAIEGNGEVGVKGCSWASPVTLPQSGAGDTTATTNAAG
jgi:hypothetical protein